MNFLGREKEQWDGRSLILFLYIRDEKDIL